MNEKVSIIIPLYNNDKYIVRCLTSVLNQTYKNIEVIVIDDGSTDCSKKVCNDFINKHKDFAIRYYYQQNNGVSSARNLGLDKAIGKWIFFLDSDDTIEENAIEVLIDIAERQGVDFVISNFNYCYSNKGTKVGILNFPDKNQLKAYSLCILNEKISNKIYNCEYSASRNVAGKLYNASIIKQKKITFDSKVKYFEDGIFNYIYTSHIDSIGYTSKSLYNYINNTDSVSYKIRSESLEEDMYKIKKLDILLKDKGDEFHIAQQIFQLDLLVGYIRKYLNHYDNKMTIEEKKKILKSIIQQNKYRINWNKEVFSYLSFKKKIAYLLILSHHFNLILFILK